MESRQFSHWLLVLVQGLRVCWALALQLLPSSSCGPMTVGICHCEGSSNENCWRDELAFRTSAASVTTYLLLVVATCSKSPFLQRQPLILLPCLMGLESFLVLVALVFPSASLYPLEIFSMFAAACYRVLQAVLFMDGAYNLNDRLYSSAVQARRHSISAEAYNGRLAMMVSASLVMILAAIGASIYLCLEVPQVTWLVISALLGSSLLLLLSITSWCEHGSLMTSSVMFAYSIYLCGQVAHIRPSADVGADADQDLPTTMLGLLVPVVSLTYFAISSSPARHLAGLTEQRGSDGDDFDANDFLLRCFVHLLADFYVTSVLAPRVSWLRFNVRAGTVFACLVVYCWTLLAPKLLRNRSF